MRLRLLWDILFPPVCLACGAPASADRPLCAACFGAIKLSDALRCGECGARLPENRKVCHKDFPYLLGAAAPYADPVVQELVRALKFRYVEGAALPLAEMLSAFLRGANVVPEPGTAVVPVPLGPRRLRTRGYNQAEAIARRLAAEFSLPLHADVLVRTRNTAPQSELSASLRTENVAQAFALRSDALRGRPVWLVDDVTTSGATFRAATDALRAGGTGRILALAAARA